MPQFFKKIERDINELKKQSNSTNSLSNINNKIQENEMIKREYEETLKNEKNIVCFKNKNCLKINWFGDFENHYVFISDYCSNKDMQKLTSELENQMLIKCNNNYEPWLKYQSENLIRFFVLQIINALECFTNIKLVHHNLTLENILLTGNMSIKITDFACSRFYYGMDVFRLKKYKHEITQPDYMPFEYFRRDNYVELREVNKIDIFSLGCCIFKMASNKMLFENYGNNLTDEERGRIIDEHTNNILDLLFKHTQLKRSTDFIKCLKSKFNILINLGMLHLYEKGRVNIEELKGLPWIEANNICIKDIEAKFSSNPNKMLSELMKSDHVAYYNKSSEYDKEYYNKENRHIINQEFHKISFDKVKDKIDISENKIKISHRNKNNNKIKIVCTAFQNKRLT